MLHPESIQRKLVDDVSALLHADQYFDAAKVFARYVAAQTGGKAPKVETKPQADELLTALLHWCLNNDGYEEAAQLCWGPQLFDHRPRSTRQVWNAFTGQNLILLMGAASMSKSYSMGVRLMLEWIRDPQNTTVKLVGPSESHLEDNLFTHLVTLHQSSTIPLPGQVGKLFIGLDTRQRKSSISGIVIPLGTKGAGRLQGSKRVNRKVPHPIFGKQTRMFIFLDEIANIPQGVWRDIDNQVAASNGDGGLKIIGAFNPTNREDEVGQRCEPSQGWSLFDPDADFGWTSTRGWFVVRLDAMQCENVQQKKLIYTGLQSWEGFQALIRNSGGMDTPGFWSMGRGCFPPTGAVMSIIPSGLLADIKGEFIWLDRPVNVAGVDLALEGADTAVMVKGCFGLATGVRTLPTLLYPNGRTVMFKDAKGRNAPRHAILVESLFRLPKGNTPDMTKEVIKMAKTLKVSAPWLCLDRTGNGQGVYDLVRHNYGEIQGVNFSESASSTRIMTEDHAVAADLYDRVMSELWFALQKFIEFGYLKFAPGLDTGDLFPQITGRRYRPSGKKSRVEEKDVYKSRNQNRSPDEADALTLLVHAVRKASGLIAGMTPENSIENTVDDYDDYLDYHGGVRIDVSNLIEDF